MFEGFAFFGLVCVAAAIVGGGLTAKGISVPVISSIPRQALLAIFGVVVVAGAFAFVRDDGGGVVPPDGDGDGGIVVNPGGNADIRLSLSSGAAGTHVLVGGTGFAAGEVVTIRFHTRQLRQVDADGEGAFSDVEVQIPEDWQFLGHFEIKAMGESSLRFASEPFEVTPG